MSIFPPHELIFNAFRLCSFDDLKVVIIGQDPYFNRGEAMGLSFSVPQGVPIPPSLRNIYAELGTVPFRSCRQTRCNVVYLETDIDGFTRPNHGDLSGWAKQGVLLLNYTLTVREGTSNSHASFGWHQFTDHIIREISRRKKDAVVFMLWGNFAREKAALIDKTNGHHILESSHPSPLGYKKGSPPFYQSKMFSRCNKFLEKKRPINWQL